MRATLLIFALPLLAACSTTPRLATLPSRPVEPPRIPAPPAELMEKALPCSGSCVEKLTRLRESQAAKLTNTRAD
jgi:hypothetical protein